MKASPEGLRKSSMLENILTYVLAGPLGAGKTSVARHWLSQRPDGERWAVLINEFGQIGIDAALLGPAADGISITEVAGGCVCCVNGAPFTVALGRLLRMAQPHRLLIELSGLSHPLPLLRQLKAEPWDKVLSLEPPIVIVDGHAIAQGALLPEAVQATLKQPCTLVINKADLVAIEDQPEVEAVLGRRGVWVTHGQVAVRERSDESWQAAASGALVYSPFPNSKRGLATVSTQPASDWSIGWQLAPDRLVNPEGLESMLQQWPWKRAKMIIHSRQGWLSANLLPDQAVAWRATEWRKDSRLELIFDEPQPLEALEKAWAACQLTPSRPGALMGLTPLA